MNKLVLKTCSKAFDKKQGTEDQNKSHYSHFFPTQVLKTQSHFQEIMKYIE